MKKVLLTGAGGFVGHHTLSHLLKRTDWEFVVTDSFRHFGTTARLRAVFEELPNANKRVRVISHNLAVPIDLQTAKEFGKITNIINMASSSHVDRSISEPRSFIENNINLALTILEYSRQLESLESLVQIGTDEVYGPAIIGEFHREWSVQLPSNPYSASKSAQEAIAISFWRTYGVPVILTNTMNIIGERQDVEKFVPLVIANRLKGKKIPVHARSTAKGWESGSRFYLHARNQADAIRFIIEKHTPYVDQYSSGVDRPPRYNVKGEVEIRNDEMALLISKFLGEELKIQDIIEYVNVEGTRPGHDLRYALDGDKLLNLGWSPPVPFVDSLQRVVEWTKNHPEWLA